MRTLLLALAVAAYSAGAASVRPRDDGRALVNPDMGLTMHFYSNAPNYGTRIGCEDDMAWFSGCSVVYLRLPWQILEPEEGFRNWTVLDTPSQRWIRRGGQVAIRVTCSEDGRRFATPEWVKKAGAKGKEYLFKYSGGKPRTPDGSLPWDPDFGDPVFLAKLENFVAAFAARYDGRPEIAFVDIGTYGLWGEGHTFMSSCVPEEKRQVDIRKHIDLWCKYMKKTQLVISDDIDGHNNRTGNWPLLAYARGRGVSWRDDSILVDKYDSWFHAEQAELYWRNLPVVLEHDHYGPSMRRGAWKSDLLVKSVEDHHASYMSIHGNPHKLWAKERASFERIARRIGYRFLASEISWPDEVSVGTRAEKFKVTFAFSNGGVAPCYRDAFPCLTVKDPKNGGIVAVLADGDFNLRALMPGATPEVAEVKRHEATFRLGTENYPLTPSGDFDVYLSVGKVDGTPVYALPLAGDDGERRYLLGRVKFR